MRRRREAALCDPEEIFVKYALVTSSNHCIEPYNMKSCKCLREYKSPEYIPIVVTKCGYHAGLCVVRN